MSSVAMGRLIESVTSLAAAPVGELPDAQVTDELLALRKLADVAEAAYLSRLAVFDARNLGEADGLSTRAWLRHRAHIAPGETSRSLKTAKGVQGLPVVAAALAAGDIRVPHAAAITDGASLLGTDVIAGCQDALVDAARTDEPSRLRTGLHPDTSGDTTTGERHTNTNASSRNVGSSRNDGDSSAGDNSASRNTNNGGSDADDSGDRGYSGGSDADDSGDRGYSGGSEGSADLGYSGFGELPDGNILTGPAVRRLACDAKITRIITGPDSQPLDVARTHRTATTAQRRALRIRDNGCRFPGCTRPPDWCDAHHITPWSHGGTTNINNLILLCRKHHTTIHEHGWTIQTTSTSTSTSTGTGTGTGTGDIEFTNPHGQPIHAPPPQPTRHLINQLASVTTGEASRPP